MAEEMIKIQIEELKTVRLVFANGVTHEAPLDKATDYAVECHDGGTQKHLQALGHALCLFSAQETKPSIEFAVSVKR
jgi:hypothetical protein